MVTPLLIQMIIKRSIQGFKKVLTKKNKTEEMKKKLLLEGLGIKYRLLFSTVDFCLTQQ